MFRLVLLALVTFAATPALAAATPWQDIAAGARARLISSDVASGGTTLVGLEIDMPQTANIYWRIPGESGIPTTLDFSASTGVAAPEIVWPFPQIEEQQGYRDYVYRGPVVLPVRVAAAEGAVLDLSLAAGVCSDICVPAMAHFSLPLSFARPDAGQSVRLDQAVAQAPVAWDQPGAPVSDVRLAADGHGLVLAGLDPSIDPQSLIADAGDPGVLFGAPQKSPDGALWTLPLLGAGGTAGLEGRSLQLLFTTPRGAFMTTRAIGAATP